MLSLCELRRVVELLARERSGARLERVVQPAAEELVLVLAGGGEHALRDRIHLLLSCRPGSARIGVPAKPRQALPTPPALSQYLRAHVEGGRLAEVRLRNEDRQVGLRFQTRDAEVEVLLSILGPRSNIYVLDGDGLLRAAARPLADTRRDLATGAPWSDPPTAPPKEGEDRFLEHTGEALLAAIESEYAELESGGEQEQRARRIRQALKKQLGALSRKERGLERDLEESKRAPEWEYWGQLLKGNLRELRPGRDAVELRDFESGEPVTVPLDPTLSAAENMARCFKRHRKAIKQGHRASQELGAVSERRRELEALREELDALAQTEPPDEAALDAFAERPDIERLLKRYFPPPPEPKSRPKLGKREIPTRLQPRRYRTQDDLEVWVGKNDDGNDMLTTKLARGRDLFFHLESSPGSHVVLRVEGKGEPPQESVLDAAELAVHFSKQRNASKASVHIAAIKDVSKPKGAKPGLVYVHRGRSLGLRRDPARIERLLASRIE